MFPESLRSSPPEFGALHHHQVDTVDAVEGVSPGSKFSELASHFQTCEVDQEFQPVAPVGSLSPPILQCVESVSTHRPAELTGTPGGMIEEAAQH